MSIFGQLDSASIPTNPYWIEEGEYPGEVTKSEFGVNKQNKKQIVLQYTIDDEGTRFHGKRTTQYFEIADPDMTIEDFKMLPSSEQDKILKTLSSLKRTLCGNSANAAQKGLGVLEEELNDPEWDPTVLVGTKINMGIGNSGDSGQYVNVRWVNLRDE